MIGGEAANRILLEVERGIVRSDKDTDDERDYREQLVRSIARIRRDGGATQLPKEWA